MRGKIASWMIFIVVFGVIASIGFAYWWYTEPDRKAATIEKAMADAEKIEKNRNVLLIPGLTSAMKKRLAKDHTKDGKIVSKEGQQLMKPDLPDHQ